MKIITSGMILSLSSLPTEEFKQAILELGKKLEKEERRLRLHSARTKRYMEKRHFDANSKSLINNNRRHSDAEEANPFILNGERHSDSVILTGPLLSKKESKRERRVSPKRSIPEDLLCSERNISDAKRIGIPEKIIVSEWGKFHDWHLGKGTLHSNWDASWRYWCRRSLEIAKEKSQPPAKLKPANGFEFMGGK
jgi:hypothetical protein